jgi:two-component system, OmpR family, alkaline phosphatase synthesis response regulator PhoP
MSEPSPRHSLTILVVDDEPSILDMLGEILADEGFIVHTATNGHQGLARAVEILPNLILTDLMMPPLEGRALLTALREEPQTAHIPVVLMSAAGHLHPDDSFDGFIAKPFSIDDLVVELLRHLP